MQISCNYITLLCFFMVIVDLTEMLWFFFLNTTYNIQIKIDCTCLESASNFHSNSM